MTGHHDSNLTGADIRAKLDHPVVDADGHMIEATFAILDFVKEVGGKDLAARYEAMLKGDKTSESRRAVWVGNSGPASIDRATAMLPRLYRERLQDAGIDYGIVYGTIALTLLRLDDDELRPVVFRAMNKLYEDMFRDVQDRLTPAAVIPMHTPEEALAELDHAVGELGHKVIVMNTMVTRPAEAVVKEAPHLADWSKVITSPAIDMDDAYDPVWAKCVELGVAPSCHNAFRGRGSTHGSPSNYVYNSLGSFADGSEYFCRSLFFGGVPARFPGLRFAFLEGGGGWAANLYSSLFEYWEKRNLEALSTNLDPAKLDIDLLIDMFDKYGDERLSVERITAEPYHPITTHLLVSPEEVNDFKPTGVTKPEDIRDIFQRNFFFGCEADDSMNAVAFDPKINRYGLKLNAILGSDIGHWDVPDMTKVMVEAYEILEDGFVTEDDFRDFTFGNVVTMHTDMNPVFFEGTALEGEVAAFRAERAEAAE